MSAYDAVGRQTREIEEDLKRISGTLERLAAQARATISASPHGPAPSTSPFLPAEASADPQSTEIRLALAKSLLRESLIRWNALDGFGAGAPVWDILMDLYVAAQQARAVSVSSACIACHVPATTALRYIYGMVKRRWLTRERDPFDRRRVYLRLTNDATALIENALDKIASGQ